MALTATDWTVDRQTGNIRYIGNDHGGGSPSYATVIEFHRWLQDKADDAVSSGDDELDITDSTPSSRSTDNIITLLNGYNIDDNASEHLYDGSIIQTNGDEIYDGIVNFGNSDVQIQIIQNGAVLADDWWNFSGAGLNADANAGISHRFLIKTRTGAADIDGRRLIGTARRFNYTYQEFKINGTARGNNVLALADATDLNNQTAAATVATWDQFTNGTEGYFSQDVNNDTTNENYYSNWNIGGGATPASPTINDLYEWSKYITRDGTATTMYGINGELFRGITHEITVDTPVGTFSASEAVSWTGGTGRMLAINSTTSPTKMWIQILTGVAPTDGQTITGGTSSATADVNVTVTDRAALITKPFIGASTGSAIIGGYGVNVDSGDLTASDKLFDLTNTQITPPNNVTGTVSGLVSTEDYVTVGQRGYRLEYDNEATGPFTVGETLTFTAPAGTAVLAELVDQGVKGFMVISEPVTGSVPTNNSTIAGATATADVNGAVDSTINTRQLVLNTSLTTDNITSVVVTTAIPTDTPSSGFIRVQDDNGFYRKLHYASYTGSTFTVDTTDGQEDFATVNATSGKNVYIAYLDLLATAASESFTSVYNADRNLFVRVRDGGGTPIKTFESTMTLTSSGGSATAIRTSDE